MKKILSLVLAVMMVLSMGITAFAAENDVVILYTNDVHAYIGNYITVDESYNVDATRTSDDQLSYDSVAALKQQLIAEGNDVLLVDAGDHVQGDVFGSMDNGATVVKLMKAAGYDVATLGNHEFDYGMARALEVAKGEVPYVSCNFYNEKDGVKLDPVLDAYKIFEAGGKKIAFVGVTTPETFTKSTPAYFQDSEGKYIYGISGGTDGQALYDDVQIAIDAAKLAGADIVIGLGHLGVDASSKPWTSEEVIANVTGLTAFIDGHSHSTVPFKEVADKAGEKVVLTQTGEYLEAIGKMTIKADGSISAELVTEVSGSDAAVKAIQDEWIEKVYDELGVVIGNTGSAKLDNYDAEGNRLVRKQETNTGDFAADALYYLFDNMDLKVDLAIMNGGGVRNKAISGDISYLTCKNIHTFGNVACLQTVTGQQILDALEWGAKDAPNENGGFLHVSGVTYEIHSYIPSTVQKDDKGVWAGSPTGAYRVQNVMVGGQPLELDKEYNLAGYNYTLRDLGDGFAMFDGAVNVLDYVMTDYMVLANYVKSFPGGVLPEKYAAPQGRITIYNTLQEKYAAPAYGTLVDGWNPQVEDAINDFIAEYGGTENAYVVFDFDNTTSIFDVEEQLAIYQLEQMAFEITPEEMPDVLAEGLSDLDAKWTSTEHVVDETKADLTFDAEQETTYRQWINDITKAYTELYNKYNGEENFDADGVNDTALLAEIHADPYWKEFAAKMRAMYCFVGDNESAAVSYPWVLYWFTGMTEQEVYDLAKASHTKYAAVESKYETWVSPAEIASETGVIAIEDFTYGTGASEQMKGLYKALDEAGIDVWVCSASATDPIRAAIDAFGLHDYVTGVIAMTNVVGEDGKYDHEYDYENGCGWLTDGEGWVRDNLPIKAQTQGVGKVTAINNAILPKYDYVGPLAGFMDSTGDYNFCTEYANLKLVINFNRASRKVTDGGGVIAELAIYQRDILGYDSLAEANANGDTYYVLQGRQEEGLRGFLNSEYTERLDKGKYLLFRGDDNFMQLQYMIDNNMTTEQIVNMFAIKTAAEDSVIDIKYGFLTEYAGYHNIANGELRPVVEDNSAINKEPTVSIDMNRGEVEANPETGAPVFALVAVIAAAAVSFKK